MNMNVAIALLLTALTGAGTVALTADQLWNIHASASQTLQRVQATNDAQLLEAATVLYQLQTGQSDTPSVERLVELGYLKPEFLSRERVQVEASASQ